MLKDASKKDILLIVVFAVYVFISHPLSSKIDENFVKIKILQKSIDKEKFINKEKTKILKIYPKAKRNIKLNKSLFFPSNRSNSFCMNAIQRDLKKIASRTGVSLKNINWGTISDKGNYIVLPISFSIVGYPDEVFDFIEGVNSSKKLIRFFMISTYIYRKTKMGVEGIVVGYKIKKDKI